MCGDAKAAIRLDLCALCWLLAHDVSMNLNVFSNDIESIAVGGHLSRFFFYSFRIENDFKILGMHLRGEVTNTDCGQNYFTRINYSSLSEGT